MKRTICNLSMSVALLLCVFISSPFSSPSSSWPWKKGTATIFDGETQWNNWSYTFARGETNDGDLALWQVVFMTEIGNSYRTVGITMLTSQPGTYTGVFDENTEKWSNNAISYLRLTVDYNGQPYPVWKGKYATVTINKYNKRTKAMSATIDAVVVMEGTSNTRNIKIKMDNLHLVDK